MIQVCEADYQEGYKIRLLFNTGESGVADLADVIHRYPAVRPLLEIGEFRKFYLDEWPTLAWPCGFDLSPESLYELATGNKIEWGNAGPIQRHNSERVLNA